MTRLSLWARSALVGLSLTGAVSCSHVRCHYARSPVASLALPTHLELTVWSPLASAQSPMGEVTLRVAEGLLDTRRNFLITSKQTFSAEPAKGCADRQHAWLGVEIREVEATKPGQVRLTVAAHLTDCRDGATLWRAEVNRHLKTQDSSLKVLTHTLVEEMGAGAEAWVAPAFNALQTLVEDLPDCHLSEEEVLERIELGVRPVKSDSARPA